MGKRKRRTKLEMLQSQEDEVIADKAFDDLAQRAAEKGALISATGWKQIDGKWTKIHEENTTKKKRGRPKKDPA